MRRYLTLLVISAVSMTFAGSVHAQEVSTSTPMTATSTVQGVFSDTATSTVLGVELPAATSTATTTHQEQDNEVRIPLLIQKIKEAKVLLSKIELDYSITPNYRTKKLANKKTQNVVTGYSVHDQNIVVAVYDPSVDTIQTVTGTQNGKKISFPKGPVELKQVGFNGVNTRFEVTKPENGIVVALKYLIVPTEAGSKKNLIAQTKEAIYTPYSDALHKPDVIRYGITYLATSMESAANELRLVASKLSPGSSVAQAVDPMTVKALFYAEHMDVSQFKNEDAMQKYIDRINVLFATNEGDTFRYSASSASARGIAQFIPSTYKTLVKRNPEAHLIADFVLGMENHQNAIKAAYMLIDEYTASVKRGVSDRYNEEAAPVYGAAAYNGGVTRVVRAVKQFGSEWFINQSDTITKTQTAINQHTASIKQLKKKVSTTKVSADKKVVQMQLKEAEAALKKAKADLAAYQKAILKQETIGYVMKIQRLLGLFTTKTS